MNSSITTCFVLFFCFSICLMSSCKTSEEKVEVEIKQKPEEIVEPKEREFSFKDDESSSKAPIESQKEDKEEKNTPTPVKAPIKKEISKKKEVKKSPPKKVVKPKGKLSFPEVEYDFGFVEVGEVVDHTFKFVNTGKKAVNISNAVASCGCTTPVFPFLPIEPGSSGQIQVRFNSKDRLGGQVATVTVYSDAENKVQELKIKGVVRSEIVSPSEFLDTLK